MTIVSGWVGSSAVGETSQRWMSAAGSTIQVGVPFWMSGLVNKSRTTTFNITGKVATDSQGYFLGFNSAAGLGSVSGDYFGRQITGLYARVIASTGVQVTVFVLSGAMTGSVSLVLLGARYQFDYSSTYGGYVCTDTNLAQNMWNKFWGTADVTITITT